uniref:Troponin I heart isoform n=2 Tax=Ciona intestinalis TaxID=7719 RepID=Q95WY1_CIOIN|nr:troponin I [Ciona intestinalis]AAL27686.2 troponin I heart isoform [Ciona intestinalis]|eukprot:XP_002119122.1 troponin I, slow skeletal muscle [Ciona intestinalis]
MSEEESSESEVSTSEDESEQEDEIEVPPVKQEPVVKEQPKPAVESHNVEEKSGVRKMTHQRKMMLKSLMLNKAREDLKREMEQKAEAKKAELSQRLEPLSGLNSMSSQELMDLCRELHGKIDKVDEQRFDIEARVKKNDTEIEELNQKIFDLRGKFKRPPLRRVRMSADQMLRALLGSKHKVSMDLRSNLKSVKKGGEKKEDAEVKDWRDNIEAKQGMGGKKAVFEGAQ